MTELAVVKTVAGSSEGPLPYGPPGNAKLLPIKFFSSWEVEKSTPNCIPRLCSLTINRLIVKNIHETDMPSVSIAIKMQSSKRVLRSNDILVGRSGLVDSELDLSFSLQYPHHLKREGDRLQIMLQRRKKYKSRAFLGFKTLAIGYISMAQVLQNPVDRQLELHSSPNKDVVASVSIQSLSSQPVDHEESTHKERFHFDLSDEDEDEELSSNEALSDDDPPIHPAPNKTLGSAIANQQRNIKQKFISLIKKFKVSQEVLQQEMASQGGSHLFSDEMSEMESLSDSCPDIDAISCQSIPKPKLTPFFPANQSSVPQEGAELGGGATVGMVTEGHRRSEGRRSDKLELFARKFDKVVNDRVKSGGGGGGVLSGEGKKERRNLDLPMRRQDRSIEGRVYALKDNDHDPEQMKLFQDQMTSITSEQQLPELICFLNHHEPSCMELSRRLSTKVACVCTSTHSDVKAALHHIINRVQKFMNSPNSRLIKLFIIGSEGYIHSVVRPFVKVVSSRSPDITNHVRFLIVPLGACVLSCKLASLDSTYKQLFQDNFWRQLSQDDLKESDLDEVVRRIEKYLKEALLLVQVPFTEVVLTHKEKGPESPSQVVVPFVGEIRLKSVDSGSDVDEAVSNSPPQSSFLDKLKEVTSHSSGSHQQGGAGSQTPSTSSTTTTTTMAIASVPTTPAPQEQSCDGFEVQMDYWLVSKGEVAVKKDLKCSLKSAFRSVQIFRSLVDNNSGLSLIFATRDKKQKIMRLGKKAREFEGVKNQQVDNISRLVCTSKSQNHLLSVNIDGCDWTGIKFFQVSSQWQTHCKYLPVLLFALHTNISSLSFQI